MSPTPNPRINTGWRTNTLAEKPGHRHEHTQADWKPSAGYVPRPVRDRWTAAQLIVAVLLGGAAVVWIALAIGGAA